MVRFLSFVLIFLSGVSTQAAEVPAPALLYGFPQMEALKQAVARGEPTLVAAYDKLLRTAAISLAETPVAITDKGATDALGLIRDPHDYVSVAIYYWPVPDNPSAPWKGIDGRANHAVIDLYDNNRMRTMMDRIDTLTLAWWLTNDRRYADAAVTQLRTWFITPATAMTPNLAYAQIKVNSEGNKGTQTGVLDGMRLVNVLSAMALLDHGGVLPAEDRRALRTWFSTFLDWFLTDPRAIRESAAKNNHGLYYDLQVMSFALFTGRQALAQSVYDNFGTKRIATQIEPDGRMPEELGRVGSGVYTCFAIDAVIDVLAVGRNSGLGNTLWTWSSPDGRSLRKAMNFIKPYIDGAPWPYGTDGFDPTRGVRLFRRVASDFMNADDLIWARKVNLSTIDQDLLLHYLPPVIPATPAAPTASSLTSATPVLSGTTLANAKVKIYDNATLLQTVTASATGAWTWTVSRALAQGSHPLKITITDATNSISAMSPATTITVPDTTAPPRPSAPTTSSLTSATPVLSGTSEANASIKIYDNGTLLRTVSANASGAWTWTVTPALAQGRHALTVTATDRANNTSNISSATTVTVPDTTPPATPAAPTSSSLTSATPVLSGTTEANAKVRIYDNTILLRTVTASATGAWSWTVSPALALGTHALKVTATDSANNTSALSAATTITVPDTTPPAKPNAPTASSLTSATPVLSGTTEANAKITIIAGTTVLKTVTASPTGAWSWTVTPSLAVGTHVITVIAKDAANNASAASLPTTITVSAGGVADTTPPTKPAAPTVSSATSATPVVSGTTEARATISLFDNALLIKTLTTNSSGSWTWTVSPALALGSHALTVIATDGAGNASAVSAATTVTVSDSTPPATPAAPAVNSRTDDTPTLSGTTEAYATVTIYDGTTRLHTAIANSVGSWSWTVAPALAQGVHQLTVTATDLGSNVSGRSPATTVTVPDITPPATPAAPTASSLTSSTPVLSGTTEANATVTIYDNATLLNTVTASTTGAWTWTVSPALAQGIHALTITATDGLNNTSASSPVTMVTVRDSTPPTTPAAPTASSLTSATPVLSGTTEANATVKIYDQSTLLKTVTASDTGAWTWTVSPALAQGSHGLKITATDGANNTSAFSPVTTVTVADTTPPTTPTAPTTSSLTSATPVLSGTTEANAKVKIYDNVTLLQTVTANASGAWTWTVSPALAQGSHPLKITATDGANNTSAFSPTTTVTVPDTTPPATPAAPAASSLVSATPVLSGTTEANAKVKIYDNATLLQTVTANASGAWTWTISPALAQGAHVLKITATDGANNTSALSPATTIIVPDTTPPATPAAPTASSLTSATPVLSGTTEANATITIFAGTTLRKTVTASPTGAWTWTVTPSLAVGTHAITVTATDAANNASATSPATTITVAAVSVADTTPPARPAAPTVSSATSSTPVVSGTTEAGATISLFDQSLLIKTIAANGSGAWSWTVSPALALGSHALTVIATDGAGNASAASAATTVTVSDTTPPATPTAPAVNSATDDTPTLSGTTEANATVTIYDGATRLHTVIANSVGSWSWTVAPALAQGVHLLTVTATDVASNVSGRSPATTITVPDITPPAKPATPTASSLTSVTPTLSGTTEAHATILIRDGDAVIETVTASGTGAWTWTPEEPFAEGIHILTVVAKDAGNNASPVSEAVVITITDTTPPTTPVAPVADSSTSATPTLTGTSEPNATIQIRIDGTVAKVLEADGSGVWTWTVEPALDHGVHVVTVTATDEAGNVSAASAATTIDVPDTTAPPIPVITAMTDGTTGSPTLSGTAEALTTIHFYNGSTSLGTTTANAEGRWSWTVTPALSEGVHLLTVVAQDAAGNRSDASVASTIVVADTVPPAIPGAPTVSNGTSPNPTISGSTESGATVTVYDDLTALASVTAGVDGTWSFTSETDFSPGLHVITVTAQDEAGNTSAASPSSSFTVPEFAPVKPKAPKPSATGVTTVTPTLAGASEPGTVIQILNGSTQIGSVTADATGRWQWTPPTPLPSGTHELTVVEVDSLGKASSPSDAIVVRITSPSDSSPAVNPVEDGAGGGCGVGGSVAMLLGGLLALGGRRSRNVKISQNSFNSDVKSK